MSVLGIGIDLVENARIQHSIERFGAISASRFHGGEIALLPIDEIRAAF
jgi:phosphopantetheinyl transferase (holo-ACP synthase)